jgi:hypothetical protein
MGTPAKGAKVPAKRAAKAPAKRGAPKYPYTEELGQAICDRIAAGGLLHVICDEPNMPSYTTVLGWLRDHGPIANPDFARMYADSVERRAEYNLDRLMQIAETPQITETIVEREVLTKDGDIVVLREVRRGDSIPARALTIDAMKWSISKQGWRKYGTKPGGEQGESENDRNIVITGGLPD